MSILIKKYSNRRLYHTEEKRYITLEDITKIIQEGQEVSIIDNDSKEDITEEILMQIVLDSFQGLFSTSLLHQMIRLQGQKLQEFLPFYLRAGLEYFFPKEGPKDLWKQMSSSNYFANFFSFPQSIEEYKKKMKEREEKKK